MRTSSPGSGASRGWVWRCSIGFTQLLCLLHNLHCAEGKVWGTTPLTQNIVAKVLKNRSSAKTSFYQLLSPNDTDVSLLLNDKGNFPTKAPRPVTPPSVNITTSTSGIRSENTTHANLLDDYVPSRQHQLPPDPLITFDASSAPLQRSQPAQTNISSRGNLLPRRARPKVPKARRPRPTPLNPQNGGPVAQPSAPRSDLSAQRPEWPPMLSQPGYVRSNISSREELPAHRARRPRPLQRPTPDNLQNDGPIAQPSEFRPGLSADRPERPRAAYKKYNATRRPQQLPLGSLNCPCMTAPLDNVPVTGAQVAGNSFNGPFNVDVAASNPAQHQRPYVAGYSSSGMTSARSANIWSAFSAQALGEQRNSNDLFSSVPVNRDISGQSSEQNSNWIPIPNQGIPDGQQSFDSGNRNRVLESTAGSMLTGNAWNALPDPAPPSNWNPLPENVNSFNNIEQTQQNSNRKLDGTAEMFNTLSAIWNPLPVGDPNQNGAPVVPDRQISQMNDMPTFAPRQTDTLPFFTTPSSVFPFTTTTPPQWMPFVPNWSTTRPPANKFFQVVPPPPNIDTETRPFFTNELPTVNEGIGIQTGTPPPPGFNDGRVRNQDFMSDFQHGMFGSTFQNVDFNVEAENNRNKNLQSGTGNLVENTFDASIFTSTTPDPTTAQWSYSYPDMNTYQPTPEPVTLPPLPMPEILLTGGVPVCPPNASEPQPPITVDIIQPIRRIMNLDTVVPICAQSVVSVVVDGVTPPGSLLGTVLAQDPGANQLQWTLESDPTGRFAINRITGEFGLFRGADLQGIDRTDVLVRATNPLNRQSCVTLIHVKVRQPTSQKAVRVPLLLPVAPTLATELFKGMDVVFSQEGYSAEIPCSLPVGAPVLRAEARSRVAGGVEYAVRGTDEFIVNATGFIFVQSLDIGKKDRNRSFQVVARDRSGKEASALVKLQLDMSTCYGPQFEMPLFIYDVTTDCSGLQPGDRIAEIKALPPSPPGKLQYGLVGAVIFSIDPATGLITSGSAVSISQRLPDFGIVVTDTFGRTDSATVRVSVTINCTKPRINATTERVKMENDAPGDKSTSPPEVFPKQRHMGQLGEYSIPVPCGTPARTEIALIRPHVLLGLEPKAPLSTALTGLSLIGTEHFHVDPATGAITALRPLPTFRTSLTFFMKAQDVRRRAIVKGKVTVKVICDGKADGGDGRERATTVVTKWRGQRRKAWLASRPTPPTPG